MVLATTDAAAFSLLLLVFVCFAAVPQLLSRSLRSNRHFAFTCFDFAGGAFVPVVIAAYTLGEWGTGASWQERLIVSGRIAGVLAFGAGTLFGLALVMLLSVAAVLGLSRALLLPFSLALTFSLLLWLNAGSFVWIGLAAIFPVAGLALLIRGIGWKRTPIDPTQPPRRLGDAPVPPGNRGLVLSFACGLAFAASFATAKRLPDPEYGPGPYAISLMFCFGLFLSAIVCGFAAAKLGRRHVVKLTLYWTAAPVHVPGVLAGVVYSIGLLSLLLAVCASDTSLLNPAWVLLLSLLPIPFTCLARSFGAPSTAKRSGRPLRIASLLFLVGLILAAWAVRDRPLKTPAEPEPEPDVSSNIGVWQRALS